MPLLLLTLFLELLGLGILIPLLPFLAIELGAGPQEVTLLVATQSLALLVSVPLWGLASDRWGRKPVILISFAGTALAFLVIALADQLWLLFLARALAGTASGDLAAGPAYIADVTTPERRARAMGLLGATFAAGFVIGPALGATLAGDDPSLASFRLPLFIAAGLAGLGFVVAALFLRESRAGRRGGPHAAARSLRTILAALHFPKLPLIASILFLFGFVFAGMESTLAIWSEAQLGWGPRQVGYLLTFAGVIALIVQGGLIGPLSRRYGEARLIVVACALLGAGMALIPFVTALPLLMLAVACLSGGYSLGNPSLQSLISRLSHVERTGGALGLGQSTISLSRVAGPPGAGFLFENQGRAAPYFAGALIMVLVVLLAERLRHQVGMTPEAAAAGD